MNWLSGLLVAGLWLLPLAADPQSTSKTHKPAHKAAAHSFSKTPTTSKATANKGAKSNAAGKRAPTGTTRLRGRKGRSSPRLRRSAALSYQLRPDPERYQQIQQSLADRGFYKGQVNGAWNDDSVQAMRDFQTASKLDADGKINSLTLMKLGLGPKHDGSGAPLSGAAPQVEDPSATNEAPLPPPPTSLPPETDPTPE